MDNILNSLKSLQAEKNFILFASEDRHVSFGDLIQTVNINQEILNSFIGKSILLRTQDNLQLAFLFSVFDGIAESIYVSSGNQLHDESNFKDLIDVIVDGIGEDLQIITSSRGEINSKINKKITKVFNTRWILPTSGTSGTPKLVAHNFESLTASTFKKRDISNHYKWGLTYNLNRFAGIQVFLQALLSASTLVIPNNINNIEESLDFFLANEVSSLSATPTMWRKFMMSGKFTKLELLSTTLGGEIASQNLLTALKSHFPNTKIRHIYASTEAGVGFSVDDTKAGFPSIWLEKGVKDCEMKLNENSELLIKRMNNSVDYVASNKRIADQKGFINTGDVVEVKGDRCYFIGRSSGVINVGGNKVHPEKIEELVNSFKGVRCSKAFGKSSAITGNLVSLEIEINNDVDVSALKNNIRKACLENLEKFMVPAFINVVDHIQLNSNGKVIRN